MFGEWIFQINNNKNNGKEFALADWSKWMVNDSILKTTCSNSLCLSIFMKMKMPRKTDERMNEIRRNEDFLDSFSCSFVMSPLFYKSFHNNNDNNTLICSLAIGRYTTTISLDVLNILNTNWTSKKTMCIFFCSAFYYMVGTKRIEECQFYKMRIWIIIIGWWKLVNVLFHFWLLKWSLA